MDESPSLTRKVSPLSDLRSGQEEMGSEVNLTSSNPSEFLSSLANKIGKSRLEETARLFNTLPNSVDLAIVRLKHLCKFCKDLLSHAEKRMLVEIEYNKSLMKLAQTTRSNVVYQENLPLQNVFTTALDDSIDQCRHNIDLCQKFGLQAFIEMLTNQREVYGRHLTAIKDRWYPSAKKIHEFNAIVKKLRHAIQHQDKSGKVLSSSKREELEDQLQVAVSIYNDRIQDLQRLKEQLTVEMSELLITIESLIKEATAWFMEIFSRFCHQAFLHYDTFQQQCRQFEPSSSLLDFVRTKKLFSLANDGMEPGSVAVGLGLEPFLTADTDVFSENAQNTDTLHASDSDSLQSNLSGTHRSSKNSRKTGKDSGSAGAGNIVQLTRRAALAAGTHNLRSSMAPFKCKICDGLGYRGILCKSCGDYYHVKCLVNLTASCSKSSVDHQKLSQSTLPKLDYLFAIERCITEVDRRGLEYKGIYRLSGQKSKVDQICEEFQHNTAVDLSSYPPHLVAACVKNVLRQMPLPLFPNHLYPSIIEISKDMVPSTSGTTVLGDEAPSECMDRLRQVVSQIPKDHLRLCSILFQHLKRVSEHSVENNMSVSNLGIVFGPTLFGSRQEICQTSNIVDTPYQARAIEIFILNCEVFDDLLSADPADDNGDTCSLALNILVHADTTSLDDVVPIDTDSRLFPSGSCLENPFGSVLLEEANQLSSESDNNMLVSMPDGMLTLVDDQGLEDADVATELTSAGGLSSPDLAATSQGVDVTPTKVRRSSEKDVLLVVMMDDSAEAGSVPVPIAEQKQTTDAEIDQATEFWDEPYDSGSLVSDPFEPEVLDGNRSNTPLRLIPLRSTSPLSKIVPISHDELSPKASVDSVVDCRAPNVKELRMQYEQPKVVITSSGTNLIPKITLQTKKDQHS